MIFKKGTHEQFTVIDNTAVQNKAVSFKARGILAYMLSLPDDWKIYEQELTSHTTDGLSSIQSGIQELINAGYIVRNKLRDQHGKFKGYEYLVFHKPHNQAISTERRKSVDGKTVNGKSTATKETYNKRKRLSKSQIKRFKDEKQGYQIAAAYELVRVENNMSVNPGGGIE